MSGKDKKKILDFGMALVAHNLNEVDEEPAMTPVQPERCDSMLEQNVLNNFPRFGSLTVQGANREIDPAKYEQLIKNQSQERKDTAFTTALK